jgi:two-component system NtrC family sensor kinase
MFQMDRMAAMGRLAAGVAHEMSNPMSYVTSNLDFLAKELASIASGAPVAPPLMAEMTEALKEARHGLGRVKEILRDLKGLARQDDELAPVNLQTVLESAARMAAPMVRARARLVEDVEGIPAVMGNSGRLGQVFLNLLLNAAQAIAEGKPQANEVRILAHASGRTVTVDIRDTGCGMTDEVKRRLFEPFFTTKPEGVGTGLGLSICQSIVAAHRGTIRAESQVGLGTLFRVELPRAPEKPGDADVQAIRQ